MNDIQLSRFCTLDRSLFHLLIEFGLDFHIINMYYGICTLNNNLRIPKDCLIFALYTNPRGKLRLMV